MPCIKNLMLSFIIFFSTPLLADTLNIPGHINSGESMSMPTRGSSMNQVLEYFGEPQRRIEAVGEPPITEWDYGDFRVYFEYQTVLHSVNLKTLIMPQ